MSVVWYDIAVDADPDDPDWYDIERVYCFDWDAFTDADWQTLQAIFRALPESRGDDPASCPRWFSRVDDANNGYLTGSVEPPGMHVFGTLRFGDWQRWDREFQARIAGLPFRSLGIA
jgi:hypothetical protein